MYDAIAETFYYMFLAYTFGTIAFIEFLLTLANITVI